MATFTIQKRNYAKSIRTYMVLIAVTLVLAGYNTYSQYTKLNGAQDALNKEQIQIGDLQRTQKKTGEDYANLKKEFDQKYAGQLDALQAVYPSEQNYTDLTREFDKFFHDNNSSLNPVSANDIKFGQARVDANSDYAILPVTMTLSGTQDNFIKFLKYIESSGDLKDKTRLMDLSSISINFIGASQNATPGSLNDQPMMNVSVSLNAYFQKPAVKASDAKSTTSK